MVKCFRSSLRIFLACLISSIVLSVRAQDSEQRSRFNITLSTGYSVENLDWSIAGKNSGGAPVDVLSELKWKRTSGLKLHLEAQWFVWNNLFVQSHFSKTFILAGTVSDTDFDESNRRDTIFHDVFEADKGKVIDYRIAAGYKLKLMKRLAMLISVGYGNDAQSLFMMRDYGNVQGDLNSSYKTRWSGLFGGCEVYIGLSDRISFKTNLTYHQLKYYAAADWNLIREFKHPNSFEHRAKGYGLGGKVEFGYYLSRRTSLIATVGYNHWKTGKGTDTLYRANGDVVITQLNSVYRTNPIGALGVVVRLP